MKRFFPKSGFYVAIYVLTIVCIFFDGKEVPYGMVWLERGTIYFGRLSSAWAAERRAMGTLKGEQET
jgi:hypothetical protein